MPHFVELRVKKVYNSLGKSLAAQRLSLSMLLARATVPSLLVRGSIVAPFLAARSRLRMLSDRIEIANSGRHTLLTRECFGVREPPLARGDLQRAPHALWWGARGPQHVLNSPRKREVRVTPKSRVRYCGG